jgi:hypothetical protein
LLAAQEGSLPGLRVGENIRHLYDGSLMLNEVGDLGFLANLNSGDGTEIDGQGIWVKQSGADLQLVVRTGDIADIGGQARELVLQGHRQPQLNRAGQLLFHAGLQMPGGPLGNLESLWVQEPDGSRRIVAMTGAAAGTSGVEFVRLDSFHGPFDAINDHGKVVFTGTFRDQSTDTVVVGPDAVSIDIGDHTFVGEDVGPPPSPPIRQGIWTDDKGMLSPVAQVGGIAPGDGRPFIRLHPLELNNAGQVLFYGVLAAAANGAALEWGLWAQDIDGAVRLIVKTGQQIDVAPGEELDPRTITSITATSSTGRNPGGTFNDRGQVLFRAEFADGTHGAFVSNAVAVPEPLALLAAALSGLAFTAGRLRTPCGYRRPTV